MARPRDVSEFALAQHRGEVAPIKVSTDAVSAVGKANASGRQSSGRAGQWSKQDVPPKPSFLTINDIDYLLDLDPRAFGKRMLALETDDDQSQGMSVVAGYQTRDAEEHATSLQIAGNDQFGPYDRAHMLLIQFGTANAPSVVEVDVCEGMAINIPGAKCEVTLLDYTYSRREVAVGAVVNEIRSHCSAANGAISTRAQMTQRVFCPYQIQLDLGNPPTFSELKQRLIEANTLSIITATGAP